MLAKQVHRDDVKAVTAQDAGAGLLRPQDYEADALVTNVPGLTLTIFSADCIPTLYFDPVTCCIGAAMRAGAAPPWVSLPKPLPPWSACTAPKRKTSAPAIGPGISRCCFETDADVPAAMRGALGAEAAPYLQRGAQGGKWHVDLKAINRHWMLRAGACTRAHCRERRMHRLLHGSVLVAPPHGRRTRQPGRHDLFEGSTVTKEAAPL